MREELGAEAKARRMEALGRIFMELAPELNATIRLISTEAERILDFAPEDSAIRAGAQNALASLRQWADWTQQLTDFGRGSGVLVPGDLNAILRRLDPMLRRLAGPGVWIEINADWQVLPVMLDPAHLEHILTSFVFCVRERWSPGVALRIDTLPAPGGDGASLTLVIHGDRVDWSTLAEFCEPLISGEPAHLDGEVRGRLRESEGELYLRRSDGNSLLLSIIVPGPSGGRAAGPASEGAGASDAGTILLVDDEPRLLELLSEILTDAGYAVLRCRDGREALTAAETAGRDLDLLVTDVLLPGQSGPALAGELSARAPGLPVLYITGVSDDLLSRHGIDSERDRVLRKPFSSEELLAGVRGLLCSRPG